jgi:hypothetical protein
MPLDVFLSFLLNSLTFFWIMYFFFSVCRLDPAFSRIVVVEEGRKSAAETKLFAIVKLNVLQGVLSAAARNGKSKF